MYRYYGGFCIFADLSKIDVENIRRDEALR